MNDVTNRVKPVQKSQGITNGTVGGIGQQQGSTLCDISAQVQQYQQFLGEEHLHIVHHCFFFSILNKQFKKWMDMILFQMILNQLSVVPVSCALSCAEASKQLPDFVEIDLQDRILPDGILLEHLKAFQTLYREHCEVCSLDKRNDMETEYNRHAFHVCVLISLAIIYLFLLPFHFVIEKSKVLVVVVKHSNISFRRNANRNTEVKLCSFTK